MFVATAIALDVPAISSRDIASAVPARRRAIRNPWAPTGHDGRVAAIATAILAASLLPVVMGAFAQAFVL